MIFVSHNAHVTQTGDVALYDRHAVGRQGACLVGTDRRGVAHRFTCVQMPYQVVVMHHFLHQHHSRNYSIKITIVVVEAVVFLYFFKYFVTDQIFLSLSIICYRGTKTTSIGPSYCRVKMHAGHVACGFLVSTVSIPTGQTDTHQTVTFCFPLNASV